MDNRYFGGLVRAKYALVFRRRDASKTRKTSIADGEFTWRKCPKARRCLTRYCAAYMRLNGGGDGTCTRVPTPDYLTFFAYSLLLVSQRQENKPTNRCLQQKEFQAVTSCCNRYRSICVVLRRTSCHAKGQKSTRWH